MFHGRRPRFQQASAVLLDCMKLAGKCVGTVSVPLTIQVFAQRNRDGTGHGLAGQSRRLARELASLIILDVESHLEPVGKTTNSQWCGEGDSNPQGIAPTSTSS